MSPDIIDSDARVRKRGRRARIWISGLQLCKFHYARDLLGFLRGEGRKHEERRRISYGMDYTLMGILLPSFPLLPAVKWWMGMYTVLFFFYLNNFYSQFYTLVYELWFSSFDPRRRFTTSDGIITNTNWKISKILFEIEDGIEFNYAIIWLKTNIW